MGQAYPDMYNDVFGPIMQPFSSSHTAAPCRIGLLANCVLGEEVQDIHIQTHPEGSFATSLRMMSVDLALLSGSTGHMPYDGIMWNIKDYCRERGITYDFLFEPVAETKRHSSAKVTLTGKSGKKIWLVGDSIGGGLVETVCINGYYATFTGDSYSVLFFDAENKLDFAAASAKLEGKLEKLEDGNIKQDGLGTLYFYNTPDQITAEDVRALTGWQDVAVLKPFVAVIRQKERGAKVFGSFTEWKALAKESGKSLDEIAIEYQMNSSGWSREEVVAYMRDIIYKKMHRTTHAHLEENLDAKDTPFTGHHYRQWKAHAEQGQNFVGDTMARAITYAMAAQAPVPGVEFVPAPMGAGGGLLYSSVGAVKETFGYSDDDVVRGLFVAAGIGIVCFTRTDPGGLNIGCAGEQGMSSCMAAGAIVAMCGGTIEQIEAAASTAMQTAVGWPCDISPGCKNQPCYSRALSGVTNALLFAQLALSGRDHVFPLDEVIDVADEAGRALQTSKPCLAHQDTDTARRCKAEFDAWGKEQEKAASAG